jgi:hypothetical protein
MNYKGNEYHRYQLEECYFCEDSEFCNRNESNDDYECEGHGDICIQCDREFYEGYVCMEDGSELYCHSCFHGMIPRKYIWLREGNVSTEGT